MRTFLQRAGLRVTSVSKGNQLIDATGGVAQVEQAFGIHLYAYTLGKRAFTAPDHDPLIPDTLATSILNIGGLDTLFHMTPRTDAQARASSQPDAGAAPTIPATCSGTPPAGAFGPAQLQGAYDVTPLESNLVNLESVDVFELAPYLPSDLANYRSCYGLPSTLVIERPVHGAPVTGDAPGTIEADLDLEVGSAIAPNTIQVDFTGPNTAQGVNDTYQYIADNFDRVVTTSWGLCEPFSGQAELTQLDAIFSEMKVAGKTIFAAAGDAGSDDCSSGGDSGFNAPPAVDSPADDPNVVGVGGTSLTLSGASYGSESVWNGGSFVNGGGGGGLSSYFSRPTWQAGNGVLNDYDPGGNLREVPDVAADADPSTGYATYCTSTFDCGGAGWITVGGTSAATPLWAASYALIGDYYYAYHSPPSTEPTHIGWGNQLLYEAFANTQTFAPYHDVTSGNNDIDYTSPPFQGDYPATACYDMASGMGSPDVWNLARDLTAGLASGGGPCAATSATYSELVSDNGFENSPSGWQQYSSGGYDLIVPQSAHDGTHAALLCGYATCDDRIWQVITVPATVESAALSLWVSGITPPVFIGNPPVCLDRFYVTLAKLDGTVIDSVQASCLQSAYDGYIVEAILLTKLLQAQEGQSLVLMFRATTANVEPYPGLFNRAYIDDVSLSVS